MGPTTARQDADAAMRLADLDPGHALAPARLAARRAGREHDAAAGAVAERAWGHALMYCGQMDDAIAHLRTAVGLGQRAGSAALAAEARIKLGYALLERGRPTAALAEVDAALRVLDGVTAARARAQRAIVLHEIGRLDEALAELGPALAALREAGDLLAVQRMLVNRGLVHADLHAFARATADFLEADRLARQLGRMLAVGIIAENLAYAERLRGDVPAALAQLERAERIISVHANGSHLGPVHRDRAELLLSVGLVAEARAAAELAITACRRERRLLKVPELRVLLAQAAVLDRDWPAALRHTGAAMRQFARQLRPEAADHARLETLRIQVASGARPRISPSDLDALIGRLAATGRPPVVTEAHLVAGQLAIRRGSADLGRRHLAGAARVARRRGPATLRARGWYAEALLLRHSGDAAGAARAARAGLRILDEHAAALGAADLRVHSAAYRADLTELGLRMAMASGRAAAVFEWAERGRASRLGYRPVRPPADPLLAELLPELRGVAAELAALAEPATGPSAAAGAALVRRQVELERRIRDHIRLRRGGGPAVSAAPPVSRAALAAALDDWALVEYVRLDGVLHALTLVGTRLRMRTLGPVAEVAGLVERLPFALHRLARGAGNTAASLTLLAHAAGRLDTVLLRPLPELDGRPLVVVPTGPLHSVPWSTLPSCHGRPVAVSPSATLWHATSSATPAGNRIAVAAGPGLPGGREEAVAVGAVHGTAPLLDGDATADAVLAALATADVVHLAAHGRLSADNPLFSSLLLADGPLVVHDVERLARVPRTVVLAACDTGRNAVRTGDELLGLAATFVSGGTAALIAPVIAVPDAETAPLMAALHRFLADGAAPVVALAHAQRELGTDDPRTLAAAAGFVCLGAGRAPHLGAAARRPAAHARSGAL